MRRYYEHDYSKEASAKAGPTINKESMFDPSSNVVFSGYQEGISGFCLTT